MNYNVSAQLAHHLPSPASPQGERIKAPETVSLAVAHAIHEHLVLAAVDLDHRAVDEEREVGGEISDEIGNLLGFGDPPERNACRSELIGLFERELHIARHRFDQPTPSLGAHRSGIDGDEANIILAVLAGGRFGG